MIVFRRNRLRPGIVRVRSRRLRQVTVVGAVGLCAASVGSAMTLPAVNSQGFALRPGEGWAMVGVGLILGGLALTPLRVRAEADADGIRVRNIVGDFDLPWSGIRAIRFRRGLPWATLDLINDEVVALLAVQAADRARAVDAIRELRALHADALTARSRAR